MFSIALMLVLVQCDVSMFSIALGITSIEEIVNRKFQPMFGPVTCGGARRWGMYFPSSPFIIICISYQPFNINPGRI